MNFPKKAISTSLLLIVALASFPVVCQADSAPPPAVIILVNSAPDSLQLSINEQQANRVDKLNTSYFSFYPWEIRADQYTLHVTTADGTFSLPIAVQNTYNNYYKLDLDSQTLTPLATLPRPHIEYLLMIVLTLAIEGGIFYLFGYRKRRSWIVFLSVNLFTQIVLMVWLGLNFSFTSPYIIFGLIFGEIVVLLIEMIAFLVFVNERSRWRTAGYVAVANIASLVLGGLALSSLWFIYY